MTERSKCEIGKYGEHEADLAENGWITWKTGTKERPPIRWQHTTEKRRGLGLSVKWTPMALQRMNRDNNDIFLLILQIKNLI